MSDRTAIVRYEDPHVFLENGQKVNDLIEKDTGCPTIQTRSMPPMIISQPLSQSAIDQLEAIDGVIVQDQDQE